MGRCGCQPTTYGDTVAKPHRWEIRRFPPDYPERSEGVYSAVAVERSGKIVLTARLGEVSRRAFCQDGGKQVGQVRWTQFCLPEQPPVLAVYEVRAVWLVLWDWEKAKPPYPNKTARQSDIRGSSAIPPTKVREKFDTPPSKIRYSSE